MLDGLPRIWASLFGQSARPPSCHSHETARPFQHTPCPHPLSPGPTAHRHPPSCPPPPPQRHLALNSPQALPAPIPEKDACQEVLGALFDSEGFDPADMYIQLEQHVKEEAEVDDSKSQAGPCRIAMFGRISLDPRSVSLERSKCT